MIAQRNWLSSCPKEARFRLHLRQTLEHSSGRFLTIGKIFYAFQYVFIPKGSTSKVRHAHFFKLSLGDLFSDWRVTI